MASPFQNIPEGAPRIVYVRPVLVSELPDDLREQVGDLETVYSVHGADGQPLALVADRNLAFHLARSQDFTPQSVH